MPVAHLQAKILGLLAAREAGKTICPSEVARAIAQDGDWRALMEPVRSAARDLIADGKIVMTQKGQVVDGGTVKGPVRLRLR